MLTIYPRAFGLEKDLGLSHNLPPDGANDRRFFYQNLKYVKPVAHSIHFFRKFSKNVLKKRKKKKKKKKKKKNRVRCRPVHYMLAGKNRRAIFLGLTENRRLIIMSSRRTRLRST